VWLSALGTQTKYGNTGHPELDVRADNVGRALEGRVLTREELAREVEQLTGSQSFGEWIRFSWGSYLKAASFRGLICFAPSTGSTVRFTSPATWVGEIDKPDSLDALREVTRRFLGAYAPLTVEDLALWWGGYGPARGRQMLEALGEEAPTGP
jgi:Winged helix DNA-binding domain